MTIVRTEQEHGELLARQKREYEMARAGNADRWVPACEGTEVPSASRGWRYLYCYTFARERHAYINLDTDMEMADEEMHAAGLMA